jgi:hypothetical protein
MKSWMSCVQNAKNKASGIVPDDSASISNSHIDADQDDQEDDDSAEEDDAEGQSALVDDQGSPTIEKIKYNDHIMEKKNVELHNLLKSVPESEMLFAVYSVALQKEIMVQGKIYLTQNLVCFYSSIMSFVTVLVIDLKEVKAVTRKVNAFYSTIVIAMGETTHNIKTFGKKDDLEAFETLKAIWSNVSEAQPLEVRKLYDSINSKLAPPKQKSEATVLANKERAESTGVASLLESPDQLSPEPATLNSSISKSVDGFDMPDSATAPEGEEPCKCEDHLEKKEQDIVLPVCAKKLYQMMFGENQIMFERFHKKMGHSNIITGAWSTDEPVPKREKTYIVPINNPMVSVKETELNENQQILRKTDYLAYIVVLNAQTPNMSYGDAFACQTKYCITWVSKDSCRLVISTGVKFFKNPMVKSIIKSQSQKSLAEGAVDMIVIIRTEVDPTYGIPAKVTGKEDGEKVEKKQKTRKQKLTRTEKFIKSIKDLSKSTFESLTLNRILILLFVTALFSGFLITAKRYSWFDFDISSAKILEAKRHTCHSLWKHGSNDWTSELGLGVKDQFYQQRYI